MSTKNQPPASGNKSQLTPNTQSPPGAKQVDDPIIVKGGSISIRFNQHNFMDLTGSTTDPNRQFDHEFQPALQRLKIFRDGAILFQTELNRTDAVMICYQGSRCPDTLPD